MLTLDRIKAAEEIIGPHINRIPLLTCGSLEKISGARLFFKCENLQKTGAFKIRGATHFIQRLSRSELKRGIVGHSAGNHAGAIALAAKTAGTTAVVVLPDNTTAAKVAAAKGYGAHIEFTEPTFEARDGLAKQIAVERNLVFIHPFDDEEVMAGQGTIGLEICRELKELDAVFVPVGGGGLISGLGTVFKALNPDCEVVGVEPEKVDFGAQSVATGRLIKHRGHMDSICEGLLAAPGEKTFPIMQRVVDRFITVNDDDTLVAMRLIWERMKIIVETSAAITLAAVLNNQSQFKGKTLCLLLTGGNVDLDNLLWSKKDSLEA